MKRAASEEEHTDNGDRVENDYSRNLAVSGLNQIIQHIHIPLAYGTLY